MMCRTLSSSYVHIWAMPFVQDAGGLAGVLLVPRSSGPALGIGAGTTITIPVDRVKSTASSAVRSGTVLQRWTRYSALKMNHFQKRFLRSGDTRYIFRLSSRHIPGTCGRR